MMMKWAEPNENDTGGGEASKLQVGALARKVARGGWDEHN